MDNKKQHILDTALSLFIEDGYENTPTSAISKKSNVATGTLFHHFHSKHQILDELYIDSKRSLRLELIKNLQSTNDQQDILHLIWENYSRWAVSNPNKFRLLSRYSTSKMISAEAREQVDNTYQELINVLNESREKGLLAKIPLECVIMLTKLHFACAAEYFITHPEALQKKKLPKRLFQAYWRAIST